MVTYFQLLQVKYNHLLFLTAIYCLHHSSIFQYLSVKKLWNFISTFTGQLDPA